jgi:hypothetical protein
MPVQTLIGTCGIVCSDCGAYLATKHNDDALRKKTAEAWSKTYSVEIRPEDIECAGCVVATGKHFRHCGECGIRACGQAKGVGNCGHCPDYPCEQINSFFHLVPTAKAVLDGARRTA